MSAIQPIAREKTLGEHAYDRLKQALMSGAFKPNQKVTVRAMAEALEVSITPARDALTRLIGEGALVSISPKTVIVPPLTHEILQEITKIRLSLEGLAAESATPHFTPADVKKLKAMQKELENAMEKKDYPNVLKKNEDFHFFLYRHSNMPKLLTMIESLWLRIGPSLNLLYPEFAEHRKGVSNHHEIMGALQRGEAGVVRAAIEKDIRAGFASLENLISQQT